jgi:hypothetical protein
MTTPRAHSEALVTDFLRDALAADAVPVPELDEKARAKGLLSERESMPRQQNESSVDTRPEPAPARRIPGIACLDDGKPPSDVPRHRWRQFAGDCRAFLSSSEIWAWKADRLGWDAMALFGCAPKAPLDPRQRDVPCVDASGV